jgi:hypothetical protein
VVLTQRKGECSFRVFENRRNKRADISIAELLHQQNSLITRTKAAVIMFSCEVSEPTNQPCKGTENILMDKVFANPKLSHHFLLLKNISGQRCDNHFAM